MCVTSARHLMEKTILDNEGGAAHSNRAPPRIHPGTQHITTLILMDGGGARNEDTGAPFRMDAAAAGTTLPHTYQQERAAPLKSRTTRELSWPQRDQPLNSSWSLEGGARVASGNAH